jgi:PucR C-terminal helix-turn-helix domain
VSEAIRTRRESELELPERLFARLEDGLDELAHELVGRYQREIPDYAEIPREELLPGVRIDIAAALAGVRSGRPPTAAELEIAARVAEERAAAGISLEALLQAFRVGGGEVIARARAIGHELEVDAEVMLGMFEGAWSWVNEVSNAAAAGHRRAELSSVRAEAQSRAAVLHGLLHGTLAPSQLHAHVASLGLDTDHAVFALRARPGADMPAHRLEALIAERSDMPPRLTGFVDGDVAAVVLRRPDLPRPVVAGIGPAVRFEALADSFADATRALEAAAAFAREGIFAIEDLALEAAFTDERIGAALERRCLAAVDALGERGEAIEQTLRQFLGSGMRYEQTAREQTLHPNTLRKRLARYEELTGLDLHRMDDLVALWWALERRRVRGGGEGFERTPDTAAAPLGT